MNSIKYYLTEAFWWTLAVIGLTVIELIRLYTNIKEKLKK